MAACPCRVPQAVVRRHHNTVRDAAQDGDRPDVADGVEEACLLRQRVVDGADLPEGAAASYPGVLAPHTSAVHRGQHRAHSGGEGPASGADHPVPHPSFADVVDENPDFQGGLPALLLGDVADGAASSPRR
mmetsp:Transcript_815/g.1398  ORF Transcript_815/g.1398 Transcript_815/m.1398 type:complete len:131 (-) Transcript_815:193-585(-)